MNETRFIAAKKKSAIGLLQTPFEKYKMYYVSRNDLAFWLEVNGHFLQFLEGVYFLEIHFCVTDQ